MKTWKAATAMLLLCALDAQAIEHRVYVEQYNLNSTSYIACTTDVPVAGVGRVKNASSGTTITFAGDRGSFGVLAAGDEVFFLVPPPRPGAPGARTRRVVSSATPTTLTVTAAVDLSGNGTEGYAWDYRKVSCGTGAEDGWQLTANSLWADAAWQIDQLNVTGGIDVRVQCRDPGTAAYTVYPDPANSASTNECLKGNFTAANACKLIITGHWQECRVQFKIGTNDDGGDTGADAESISAFLNLGPASR